MTETEIVYSQLFLLFVIQDLLTMDQEIAFLQLLKQHLLVQVNITQMEKETVFQI